ncbi:MAG: DUF4347 domain-containing protein [Cyanobacteria bacterium P01_G01_bin.54]
MLKTALIAALPLGLWTAQPLWAQSITPAADGTGTIIEYNGNTYTITGGTNAGTNLFHSFEQFGLQPSEIADFLSNPAIQNVVGRVIGGDPSVIEGLIRLSGGNSNLFLVNPAGWVFADGASVDVPGSLGISTATRIGFGSEFFNAIGENNYAALTGDPTSLIFDTAQPGAIINTADLNLDGSLWMVGGSVISTGSIDTATGTVTLAAVPGESKVSLTHEGMALGLILDALPAEEVQAGMPLGLAVTDLPRYLTGDSHIGSAGNLVVAEDGSIHLIGSELRLDDGQAVVGKLSTVEDGQLVVGKRIAAQTINLIAADRVHVTDPTLVQGDTTVVRLPGADGTNTLSLIDSRADNPYFLLYGGAEGTISRIVNRGEDGIEVITTELAEIAEQGGQVDAVSITAEGHEGNFWLGNTWITHESVQDYSDQLATWGAALTESADLLLYSCFTALGDTGAALMNSLAQFTGADVAASTNATGSANYSGDWTLESSTGSIEAETPFTDETLDAWTGKLATLTVTNANDAGAGSLRQRIETDAAAGDMITFDTARTVTLTSGSIAWATDNLTLDGNGSTVDGNANERVFTISASNATLENLTVTNGRTTGADDGAGINHTSTTGALTLNNVTVTGNSSNDFGGGIIIVGASLSLNNSTIANNSAADDGGGIHSNFGSITLTNSTVSGNTSNDFGGGISSFDGTVSFINSTLSNNSANDDGGGMRTGSADINLTNSTVSGNTSNDFGGGINTFSGTITIENSTLADNSAADDGGALFTSAGITSFNNSTVSGNSSNDLGGGLSTNNGSLSVSNSTVSGNSAADDGGGIRSNNGSISLTNSTVSGNTSNDYGGGIATFNGTVSLSGSNVSGNSAANDGGGIRSDDGTTTLTNSTVTGNTSGDFGGGIAIVYANTTLINSTVSGNSAADDGGGIRIRTKTLNLINSTVSGNTTNDRGGGIATNNATISLNYSTVSGNSATGNAGGLYANNGAINLTNATVSGNSAGNNGGGIAILGSGSTTTTNATIAFNSASNNGGGIYVNANGTGTLRNTIIANNSAATNSSDLSGTFTANHNLILNTAGATINGSNNITGQDPLLQPLAFNGGSATQTHALDFTSPAINAGSNEFISGLSFDQSAIFTRIFGGTVDIGAYEVNPEYLTTPFTFAELYIDPLDETELLVDGVIGANACRTVPEVDLDDEDTEQQETDEIGQEKAKPGKQKNLDEDCLPLGEISF